MANELIYVPLDFESRYVGKEVIGMLGYRLGKSGTSLLISGVGYLLKDGLGVSQLVGMSSAISVVWLGSAHRLTQFLPKGKIGQDIILKKGKKH